ncbi:hypothetical protein GCM10022631_17520 [Deinococcus rubellus]|uniref:hypothetical protein n=1 Tax=Deinococcus rubellus TaxID=1889240 RepID=UPI0031E55159
MNTPQRLATQRSRWSASHNPLVVQFWLLGLDVMHGHLLGRGFSKATSPAGSSLYTLDGLTLHSKGLWLTMPQVVLHYLRPREAFYQLSPQHDPFGSGLRPPSEAAFLKRAEGLALARPHLLEHEVWIVQQHGPDARAALLRQRLPPRIRRLVPAWEAWMAGRHSEIWTPPGLRQDQASFPPFRLTDSPA